MSTTKTLALLAAMIPVACGQLPTPDRTMNESSQSAGAASNSEEAANELFLADMAESAADAANTTATDPVDDSVKDDTKPSRLAQIVETVFKELDLDASGDLTLDEFLAGPTKRAEDKSFDAEKTAKVIATVTADFEKYSGDDKLLSEDELKTLLSEVAPRIGKHRHKKHRGRHGERVKQSWEEISSKYDTDKDGKLSKDEFEGMRSDQKEKHRQVKVRGYGRLG